MFKKSHLCSISVMLFTINVNTLVICVCTATELIIYEYTSETMVWKYRTE